MDSDEYIRKKHDRSEFYKFKKESINNCYLISTDGTCKRFVDWNRDKDGMPTFIQIIDGIGNSIAFSINCFKQMKEFGRHEIINSVDKAYNVKAYKAYYPRMNDGHRYPIDNCYFGAFAEKEYYVVEQEDLYESYNYLIRKEIDFDGYELYNHYVKKDGSRVFDPSFLQSFDVPYRDFTLKAYIPSIIELTLFSLYEEIIDRILRSFNMMTYKDFYDTVNDDVDIYSYWCSGIGVQKSIHVASTSVFYAWDDRTTWGFYNAYIMRLRKEYDNTDKNLGTRLYRVPLPDDSFYAPTMSYVIPFYKINNSNVIKTASWTGETLSEYLGRTLPMKSRPRHAVKQDSLSMA